MHSEHSCRALKEIHLTIIMNSKIKYKVTQNSIHNRLDVKIMKIVIHVKHIGLSFYRNFNLRYGGGMVGLQRQQQQQQQQQEQQQQQLQQQEYLRCIW